MLPTFLITLKMAPKKRRLAANEVPMIPVNEYDSEDYASPLSDLDCEDVSDCEPIGAKLVTESERSKPQYSRVPLSTMMRSFKPESKEPRQRSHKKLKLKLQPNTIAAKGRHSTSHADGFTPTELQPTQESKSQNTPKKQRTQKQRVRLSRHTFESNLFPLEVRKGPHPDVEFLERPRDSAVTLPEPSLAINMPLKRIDNNVAHSTRATPSVEPELRRRISLDDRIIYAKLSTISAPARNTDPDTSEDEEEADEPAPSVPGRDDDLDMNQEDESDDVSPKAEEEEDTSLFQKDEIEDRAGSLSPPFSPTSQFSIDDSSDDDMEILEPAQLLQEKHLGRPRQHSIYAPVEDDISDDEAQAHMLEPQSRIMAPVQASLTSRRTSIVPNIIPPHRPRILSAGKSVAQVPMYALSRGEAAIRTSLTSKRAPTENQPRAVFNQRMCSASKQRIVIDLDNVNNAAHFPMSTRRQERQATSSKPLLTSKQAPTDSHILSLLNPSAPAPNKSKSKLQRKSTLVPTTAGRYFETAQEILRHDSPKPPKRTMTTRFSSLFDVYEDPPSPTMEYAHLYSDHPELIPPPSGQGERLEEELTEDEQRADEHGRGIEVVRRSSLLLEPQFYRKW